jgi:glycosyltransferase involved in cell wall biosynthesis
MDLSVVVPVFNERDNIAPLYAELKGVLDSLGRSWEVLFVDDGSTDSSEQVLRALKAQDERVRGLRLARNCGQTAALACGLKHARGDLIITLDGDGENDPADIPALLSTVEQGYDLVTGWRVERWKQAYFSRKLPSLAANFVISSITRLKLHDYGCTLKAYRRSLAAQLRLYGEMHRFIPFIALQVGARIAEIPVNFRERQAGHSKYGLSRVIRTLLDLITVMFLSGYSTRPIQVFGTIGVVLATLGGLWTTMLVFEKVVLGFSLAQRPALLLAVLLLVVGVQFISLGLLGEMLTRIYYESQDKPIYVVKEEF